MQQVPVGNYAGLSDWVEACSNPSAGHSGTNEEIQATIFFTILMEEKLKEEE
ncbi:MAG TPA: hypothetical protein PLD84_06685 [Chitinophagales bacterium]|nr:hypothetical protein [Chitinophagales bacterium]